MPTNPNSPFGFKYVGKRDADPPNFGTRTALIASANTNAIFSGDVLKPLSSGYLDVFTAPTGGGAPVGGIAGWFSWISTSQSKTVTQNWWPGNGDATGDVYCHYQADSDAIFVVQALLGPITQASVGLNANFNVGSGGSQTPGGISSFSLDDGTLGTGASLPFTVYQLPEQGPLSTLYILPGYDPANAYNQVFVTFHNLTA